MRVALVESLPFHRWVLQDLASELAARGAEVRTFTHRPSHHHDWLQNQRGGILDELGAWEPGLVVAADYPYGFLRDAARAPVVAVRHSLASRRNTWEKEQAEADWLVTWSEMDEALLSARGVQPRCGTLRAGCPWLGTVGRAWRERLLDPLKVILWAPTWNRELSCRDQVVSELEQLAACGWAVLVKPHPATCWREPAFLESLSARGFEVLSSDEVHPGALLPLLRALVTDVSGMALLGACVPGSGLPVLQVDAPGAESSAQFDPEGPEWTLRSQLGVRLEGGQELAAIAQLIDGHGEDHERCGPGSRVRAVSALVGEEPWRFFAAERLATMMLGLERP